MQVRVLFFGILRDLAGQASESLNLPEHASLGDLLRHYENRIPSMQKWSSSLAMSINQEYAHVRSELHAGDEVALLPPVSGGNGDAAIEPACVAKIAREKIDTPALLEKIKAPEDGAVVVFEGVVRNHSRGRRTLYLDYEAYDPMALKEMNGLIEQALARFPVREVVLVHRIGRLEIGATSVLVVVASAHRGAAFDACRWLIDTLKRTVPIWKKEYFEDGAVWADGQPFPEEISLAPSSRGKKPASK